MAVAPRLIRVLCVDDHRLIREGVARIVDVQPDMEVVAEASNGEHAVAEFLASRPDVTLMDLQLPVTSGAEATRRIRQLDDAARIIVLTMYHGDEDIHRAFEAGAMGYVLKDAISDDLIHVIREVYAGRRVVTPEIQQALDERARQPRLSQREH
jgi:DNA-binding NarL/FixJ family response regulator